MWLGTEVVLIPTKLSTYTDDTTTHSRVGQSFQFLVTQCIRSVQRQSRLLASGWQSLPTDEAGFREAEPSYDETQTLCDPGWQSQPMIDHNLYTKYLKTRKLTLTKHLLYYNTRVLHKSTQHTLFMWLSQHSPSHYFLASLIYHALGWMGWQGRGSLFIGLQDHWIIYMWQNHSS